MSTISAITYEAVAAVTPSDTANQGTFAGLLVIATGNVSFITLNGVTVSMTAVAANTIIPIAVTRVKATGTSATVVGLLAAPYDKAPPLS